MNLASQPSTSALVLRAPLDARRVGYVGPDADGFSAAYGARNPTAELGLEGDLDLVVVDDLAGEAMAMAVAMLGSEGWLVGAMADRAVAPDLAKALSATGLAVVRLQPALPATEPFDDDASELSPTNPAGEGPAVVVARKGGPPLDPLHVETAIYAPRLMDIRTRMPAQALRSDPELTVAYHGTPFDLPELPRDRPKVLVMQRPALTDPKLWRGFLTEMIAKGWLVVLEYDDHPTLVAEANGRQQSVAGWLRYGYVHAVQTSTPALAQAFGAYNPETRVFANMAFDLAPFPDGPAPRRVFYGAVWRGAFAVQVARSLAPAIADHPDTEFLVMGDRAVFDALPTARKTLRDHAPYEEYLKLMASCAVSLSPIEGRAHQETKSDAKFLDAARAGVLTIASPTIYAETIQHGINGLIAQRVRDWAPLLTMALGDETARAAMARRAWDYVRTERMFASQIAQRKAWYRDLWDRREALNEAVMRRLPGPGRAS